MHELPATRGILSAALDAAREAGATRIEAIDIVIGDLSSFVDDSVQFYFDALSRGTEAEGAVLRFHRVAATARCFDCGASHEVRAPLPTSCPACGSFSLRVSGGDELYVESIEVDDEGSRGEGDPEGERPGGRGEPGDLRRGGGGGGERHGLPRRR